MGKLIDLTGQRFGQLTVIELDKERSKLVSNRSSRWICQCDCGNLHTASSDNLCRGNTKSCGCLKYEKFPKDLTGLIFYRLTVLGKSKRCNKKGYHVFWDCKCQCGNKTTVESSSLRSGNTKSCGCLRKENQGGLCLGSNWLNK
jgi:hypothetical protein